MSTPKHSKREMLIEQLINFQSGQAIEDFFSLNQELLDKSLLVEIREHIAGSETPKKELYLWLEWIYH